jgi:glucose/arabinose dehydrogenase
MKQVRAVVLSSIVLLTLSACAPSATETLGTDRSSSEPAAVVSLESALEQLMSAAGMLSDPTVKGSPDLARLAVIGGAPMMLGIRADLELAEAELQGPPKEMVRMALDEVASIMAIAGVIAKAPDEDVLIHHAELLVHGGAALAAVNQSLHQLGAGPSAPGAAKRLALNDLEVLGGYEIEVLANDLTFATVVEVGNDGTVYVGEAGFSYGGIQAPARVLRVLGDGSTGVVAEGFDGPLAGLALADDGSIYVSHRGTVTRVDPATGARTDIITGLPSAGDHYNENLAIGPDGKLYITQGTATNSGVVGLDNYLMGWLPLNPEFHDVPCRDLTLSGNNYRTGNPLSEDPKDTVETGAYLPFGTPSTAGQVVRGQVKCSGSVLRANLDGSALEVFADGLRNPYGLTIDALGRVIVTENGPDDRGSRPVYGPDNLYEVVEGGWYGWPDFYGGERVDDDDRAAETAEPQEPVLSDPPRLAASPAARFDAHSSSNGLDVSRGNGFSSPGTLFVAQLGDMSPVTSGGTQQHAGHQVVMVDSRGKLTPFLVKRQDHEEGSSAFRPTDATFDPSGESLYVTHFGVLETVPGGIMPVPETGALIRIRRSAD